MDSSDVDESFKQSKQQVCKHFRKRDAEERDHVLATLLEIETKLYFQEKE